jgi:hypothetical protein
MKSTHILGMDFVYMRRFGIQGLWNFRSCSEAGRARVGAKYSEGPISQTFPYVKYNRKRKGKKMKR